MLLTSLFMGKKRKVIQFCPNGDVLCEEPENASGKTIVSKNNIGPIEYEIGDKVVIIKDWQNYSNFHHGHSLVGEIGSVIEKHPYLQNTVRVQGDNFAWWYKADEVFPAEINGAIPKKKVPRIIN